MVYFAHFVVRGACMSMLVTTPRNEPAMEIAARAEVCLTVGSDWFSTIASPFVIFKARGDLSLDGQVYSEDCVLQWLQAGMPALQGAEPLFPSNY